jgi:F-type H+-transporting ATPase subunit delta
MTEGSLARRYTRALFQLAREAGQEESVGAEIEQFHTDYSHSDLQSVLTNPAFPVEIRKQVFDQVASGERLSSLTLRFLSLLLERDRLSHLAGIVNCYRRLLNEAKGRVDAKVVSVTALEPSVVERLRGQLRAISGKEVILQQVVDPDLLGGLQVELEGKIYDGSLRTQLENMKQRIARGY